METTEQKLINIGYDYFRSLIDSGIDEPVAFADTVRYLDEDLGYFTSNELKVIDGERNN